MQALPAVANPGSHLQMYDPFVLTHTESLGHEYHALLEHSSMSLSQSFPVQPDLQTQSPVVALHESEFSTIQEQFDVQSTPNVHASQSV